MLVAFCPMKILRISNILFSYFFFLLLTVSYLLFNFLNILYLANARGEEGIRYSPGRGRYSGMAVLPSLAEEVLGSALGRLAGSGLASHSSVQHFPVWLNDSRSLKKFYHFAAGATRSEPSGERRGKIFNYHLSMVIAFSGHFSLHSYGLLQR